MPVSLAGHSVAEFINKINAEYPKHFHVEISVLDANGDKFDVYSGRPRGLHYNHLTKVFRDTGCFYMFTVLGIEEDFLDSLDQHQSEIQRLEFCWLVEPVGPEVSDINSRSAKLSWKAVSYCGFELPTTTLPGSHGPTVRYELELAAGHPYKVGIGSHFASDEHAEYHVVSTSSDAGSLIVEDLEPCRWYFTRVSILYLNARLCSVPVSFYTPFSEPDAPARPRLWVIPEPTASDVNVQREPKLLLSWSYPKSHGLPINMCEVQFQQVLVGRQAATIGQTSLTDFSSTETYDNSPGVSVIPEDPVYTHRTEDNNIEQFLRKEADDLLAAKLPAGLGVVFGAPYGEVAVQKAREEKRKQRKAAYSSRKPILHTQSVQHSESLLQTSVTSSFRAAKPVEESKVSRESMPAAPAKQVFTVCSTPWTYVYRNKDHRLKLKCPTHNVAEWRFRVRCCNLSGGRGGWSQWSPILYLHAKTHPELFNTDFHSLRMDDTATEFPAGLSTIIDGSDAELDKQLEELHNFGRHAGHPHKHESLHEMHLKEEAQAYSHHETGKPSKMSDVLMSSAHGMFEDHHEPVNPHTHVNHGGHLDEHFNMVLDQNRKAELDHRYGHHPTHHQHHTHTGESNQSDSKAAADTRHMDMDLDVSGDFVFIAEDNGPDIDGLDAVQEIDPNMRGSSPPTMDGLSQSYPAEASELMLPPIQKQRPSSTSSADRSVGRMRREGSREGMRRQSDGASTLRIGMNE